MNQIELKKMKARFLTLLTTLAFLGISVSVLAGPPDLCTDPIVPGEFCDQDGDGLIRDHKKCPGACGGTLDPDDDCFSGDPCDVVSSDDDIYTVELTSGAFRFAESDGGDPPTITMTPPIPVTKGSHAGIGLESVFDVEMHRPTGTDPQALKLKATWDRMFAIGCPELGTSDTHKIYSIISTYDDWNFTTTFRLALRDIRVNDSSGTPWDITMQLIPPPNYDPYDGEFLPLAGQSYVFELERGGMWGREVSGGPGGRKSCGNNVFYLCEQPTPEGLCEEEAGYDATAVLRIVNPTDPNGD